MVETTWNELEIATKSVVMQAAIKFAEIFAESREYKEFEQSYIEYRQDTDAQSAIQQYQMKQSSLKALLMLNAVSEEDQKELQRLHDSFYNQPSVLRYIKAQEELVAISQEIGDLLSKRMGLDYGSSCKTGGCCG